MEGSEFALFRYTPNLGAAVLFVLLFTTAAALHTYQVIATRCWFYTAFIVGGWLEAFGFIARAVAAEQSPDWTVTVYAIQTIFVLVAPSVFAASIYMCVGKIIYILGGEKHSPVRRQWLTKIFVIGDVFSFIMQGAGGGIMASGTPSALDLGETIIIIGLAVQIAFFSGFVVVTGVFHLRITRNPTNEVLNNAFPWRTHLLALYVGSTLIWIRCVFRLIEYAQGNDGYLISHEVYLYIFDAALMLFVMALFALVHPSELNAMVKGPGSKSMSMGLRTRNV